MIYFPRLAMRRTGPFWLFLCCRCTWKRAECNMDEKPTFQRKKKKRSNENTYGIDQNLTFPRDETTLDRTFYKKLVCCHVGYVDARILSVANIGTMKYISLMFIMCIISDARSTISSHYHLFVLVWSHIEIYSS